jgi:hypothetical protein
VPGRDDDGLDLWCSLLDIHCDDLSPWKINVLDAFCLKIDEIEDILTVLCGQRPQLHPVLSRFIELNVHTVGGPEAQECEQPLGGPLQ